VDYNSIKTKEEAIEWIHGLMIHGIKPGLERMEWLLKRLGNPEKNLKFIHIAGTNGKGSTLSFISKVLIESGYKVGMFTSPYLIEFTNRIQTNGEDISGEDLVELTNQVIPLVKELESLEWGIPTEFEVVTTIALQYYSTKALTDVVLWETGLGGRLDSTNVVLPLLSIITNIGYDHMNYLGSDIKDIAKEKAGIIKSGVPVISGVENEEALEVIRATAKIKGSTFYQINEQFSLKIHNINQSGSVFEFASENMVISDIKIKMIGPHQVKNAAVSIKALEILKQDYEFNISDESLYRGMSQTFWAGRFEIISKKPLLVLDGAHNPEGAESLKETLSLFDYKRLIIVLGILSDKEIKEYLEIILPIADIIIITEPEVPRAANAEEIKKQIYALDKNKEVIAIKAWREAISQASKLTTDEDLVLITGSLYLIADARKLLLVRS